ncbi:MAG TPA: efflux RND transporter periplasmic adaptor subunit, partial [Beijerinckiaceae bacterium]|nr:efflux RND transporter periplasmic adaptor subunit [Beijerinckiaceae bacterium]
FGIQEGQAASSGAQYVTALVEIGEVRRTATATGTLNATVNVEVGSQLSGQIATLFVDFNDEVKKGQPLAQLDQKTFKARVAEAQAAIAIAEVGVEGATARVERARIDGQDSEAQRAVLKARTDNARVKLEAAKLELRRKESLRDRQTGSLVELADSETKVASASAALREAEAIAAAHENVIAGTKADLRRAQSELDTATASVPQRKALLQIAEIELERTIIRSPVDGVVVGRNVNEGQTLATTLEAKTLFIIAGDLHQMEIHAKVDEADIGKIRVDQEAVFSVDAHPGRQFTATVRQVRKAPQVQQNVVTYTVVLTAANPDNLLLPGMTAVVRITLSKTGPVLKMPLAALRFTPPGRSDPAPQGEVERGKPASVWLSDDGRELRPVVIGLGDDDSSHVAILSGHVRAGDRVVVGEVVTAAPRQLFGIRIGL